MIAAARAMRRQTQAQLADELNKLSHETWTRNNVAAIENGQRAFEVKDLWIFAAAQDRPLAWYLGEDVATVPAAAPTGEARPGLLRLVTEDEIAA